MSAIEIQTIWTRIHELKDRISELEQAMNGRMNAIQLSVDAMGEDIRGLHTSIETLTRRIEQQMSTTLKAYIDASFDVLRTEMRAYVRGLVPLGL